jgi:hypothetical protein
VVPEVPEPAAADALEVDFGEDGLGLEQDDMEGPPSPEPQLHLSPPYKRRRLLLEQSYRPRLCTPVDGNTISRIDTTVPLSAPLICSESHTVLRFLGCVAGMGLSRRMTQTAVGACYALFKSVLAANGFIGGVPTVRQAERIIDAVATRAETAVAACAGDCALFYDSDPLMRQVEGGRWYQELQDATHCPECGAARFRGTVGSQQRGAAMKVPAGETRARCVWRARANNYSIGLNSCQLY